MNSPVAQIWCAAGVNLTGGKTRDGGSVVGASVFYASPPAAIDEGKSGDEKDDVEKLNQELKVLTYKCFIITLIHYH